MSKPSSKRRQEAVAAIERAMVRIRRSQTRRTLGRRMVEELGEPLDLAHAAVVDAVAEGGEVNVGVVGARLGIDPSRASRVVASAIASGYVKRVASQEDGRAVHLELTSKGERLERTVRAFRTKTFARVVEGWSEHDCAELARLLDRFTAAMSG